MSPVETTHSGATTLDVARTPVVMDQLRAMLAVLSSGTRKRLVLAVIGSALVGLAEVVGLLMILPLMQLLTGSSADEGAVARAGEHLRYD